MDLAATLSHQPLVAVATLFGAGIVTSLTPCIYPMIPITAGIISGTSAGQASRARTVALTVAYVTGLALFYAAGEYDRRTDPTTGRSVVVAGTYHPVPPRPVGPLQALVAIPRGMADAAAVIFFVFLIGGAFTVVDDTGALRQGVEWLVRRVGHSQALVIPAASLAFALGGVLDNMKEEIIALVPVLLLLTRRLGI